MDIPGKRPQLTMASTISPEDTVVIVQGGFNKKLPISYLLAAGQSGWSGFSGFSGQSGINGEYAASGFSGFSGQSGFSGASAFVKIEPSHVVYGDEKGNATSSKDITTDGKTLTLSGDAPQVVAQKNKQGRSIQIFVNDNNGSIAFHSQPYCSTFLGMGLPDAEQGADLVLSASAYGLGLKEILRVVNAELTLKMSRKLIVAESTREYAGLNVPIGIRPDVRKDGDVWRESDGLYVQVGQNAIGPLSAMSNVSSWKKVQAEITVNGHPRILGECTHCDFFYRRVGDSMECRIDIRQSKGVESIAGDYLIVVPDKLNIDEEKMNFMNPTTLLSIGSGILYDYAPNNIGFQPRDSKNIGVLVNNTNWNSSNHNLNFNNFNLVGSFVLPIKEWK